MVDVRQNYEQMVPKEGGRLRYSHYCLTCGLFATPVLRHESSGSQGQHYAPS